MRFLPTLSLLLLLVASTKAPDEQVFVARVIFAEASICSPFERQMVAAVMSGRIHHPGFANGKLDSMYAAASQKGAFSCTNDPKNKNWKKTENPDRLTPKEKEIWVNCLELAKGAPPAWSEGRTIVYYHDKSIEMPRSWNNKYWRAIKELETKHFIFYSVVKQEG